MSNFFDLHDYITSVQSPELARDMASSTAWKIDAMITQAARSIYRENKDTVKVMHGIDSYAELENQFKEAAFAESCFNDNGSSNIGAIETIQTLHHIRELWHNTAKDLTELTFDWEGKQRTYETPDLNESIHNPKAGVAGTTKQRLKTGASRKAEAMGMADMANVLYQKRLDRAQADALSMVDNMKRQADVICLYLDLALKFNTDSALSCNFHTIPVELRRQLIDNAIKAAEQCEERAAKDRSLSDSDYDMICLGSIKAVQDLQAQLKASTFKRAAQVQAASESMTG